jgi:hypothetical protein
MDKICLILGLNIMLISGFVLCSTQSVLGASNIAVPGNSDNFTTGIPQDSTFENFTGNMPVFASSIPVFPTLMQALGSKINTNLMDATANAIETTGTNSSALSALLLVENGFLVYRIIVTDPAGVVREVLVDPGNGKILSSRSLPTDIVSGMIMRPSIGPLLSFSPNPLGP